MSRSVIHAGYADQALCLEEIPKFLLWFVEHPYVALDPMQPQAAEHELEAKRQLERILTQVHTRTGHDFALYKRPLYLGALGAAWASPIPRTLQPIWSL
jgi:hypothetical protein